MKYLLVVFSLTAFSTSVFAHGGGIDQYGCHHNKKKGGYHCHQQEFSGKSFKSKDEMLKKRKKKN